MIAEGNKQFLKNLCLFLKQGMLSTFFKAYAWVFSGIRLKVIGDFGFCKFCKVFLVFCTNVVTEIILNLILVKYLS